MFGYEPHRDSYIAKVPRRGKSTHKVSSRESDQDRMVIIVPIKQPIWSIPLVPYTEALRTTCREGDLGTADDFCEDMIILTRQFDLPQGSPGLALFLQPGAS
jgi:hypothetical protein